jgi:anti-sigma factor RsiW
MAKITRLTSEQRENLVAYLDGELDEPTSQSVEQVLAESVVARHDVDMLSRTWDLLNVLPGIKASEEFSRKTLTSIRAAEAPRTSSFGAAAARHVRRGVVLAAWLALVAAFGVAGFEASRRFIPDETEQLLDDYDVILRLDEYTEVGDVEFLRILNANRTLADHHEPADK